MDAPEAAAPIPPRFVSNKLYGGAEDARQRQKQFRNCAWAPRKPKIEKTDL